MPNQASVQFFYDCINGNAPAVQRQLRKLLRPRITMPRIDVNVDDGVFGDSLLYWACLYNEKEIVRLLLKYGALLDVNQTHERDRGGLTPLQLVCAAGKWELYRLLIGHSDNERLAKAARKREGGKCKAPTEQTFTETWENAYGRTAADYAALYNRVHIVKDLITVRKDSAFDVGHRANLNVDPFTRPSKEILDLIKGAGLEAELSAAAQEATAVIISETNPQPREHHAPKRGDDDDTYDVRGAIDVMLGKDLPAAIRFFKLSSSPNRTDERGCTALMAACYAGFLEGVELLLKHPGLDPNMRDSFGRTAYYFAAARNRLDVLRAMNAARMPASSSYVVDVTIGDREGRKPGKAVIEDLFHANSEAAAIVSEGLRMRGITGSRSGIKADPDGHGPAAEDDGPFRPPPWDDSDSDEGVSKSGSHGAENAEASDQSSSVWDPDGTSDEEYFATRDQRRSARRKNAKRAAKSESESESDGSDPEGGVRVGKRAVVPARRKRGVKSESDSDDEAVEVAPTSKAARVDVVGDNEKGPVVSTGRPDGAPSARRDLTAVPSEPGSREADEEEEEDELEPSEPELPARDMIDETPIEFDTLTESRAERGGTAAQSVEPLDAANSGSGGREETSGARPAGAGVADGEGDGKPQSGEGAYHRVDDSASQQTVAHASQSGIQEHDSPSSPSQHARSRQQILSDRLRKHEEERKALEAERTHLRAQLAEAQARETEARAGIERARQLEWANNVLVARNDELQRENGELKAELDGLDSMLLDES
ncbi:hypothetical protein DFJ74DRAFT_767175 [Hyaloraphidium curvatum]|nr:hypothetical protein DFJ74DRAFT_767175 [Hyaloraphidium curvatum]